MSDVDFGDGILVRILDVHQRVGTDGIPFVRLFLDTFEDRTNPSLTFWASRGLGAMEADRIYEAFGVSGPRFMKGKWATAYRVSRGSAIRAIRPATRKDMDPLVAVPQREILRGRQNLLN